MSSLIVKTVGKKFVGEKAKSIEPRDSVWETTVDQRGKKRRTRRPLPQGLSKQEEVTLTKIRKRARRLDYGLNLCGFRVGVGFFIGLLPVAGDIANALLNFTLVLLPASKLDLPKALKARMSFNNAVAATVGFVPIIGDIILGVWKANSRNCQALEVYFEKRNAQRMQDMELGKVEKTLPSQQQRPPAGPELAAPAPVHTPIGR